MCILPVECEQIRHGNARGREERLTVLCADLVAVILGPRTDHFKELGGTEDCRRFVAVRIVELRAKCLHRLDPLIKCLGDIDDE